MPVYNPPKVSVDRYRGSDHTTVTSPEAGDYTLETGRIEWLYDGTAWARRTAIHWGESYPDGSFNSAFNTLSGSNPVMLPAIAGDLVRFTQDNGQMGNTAYVGRYNGDSWENISGVDPTLDMYSLTQSITTVDDRITTEVSTLNDTISNLSISSDYYRGSDHTNLGGLHLAGMYTLETNSAFFFNGTVWKEVAFV
jgi:hypothetical protein